MSAPQPRSGLYDPRFDHDGCGVAFVARAGRAPAHDVVALGLQALINLDHRGARGADPESGDGAGILIQLPDAFLRATAGFELPPPGRYGVGMLFLPTDPTQRRQCEGIVADACADEGLRVAGWRDVSHDATAPGGSARDMMPVIRQVFVAAIGLRDELLERRLYVLRRVIERRAAAAGFDRSRLHAASFSSRTLVYK
ncbi:MAG: glutamate synthase subunit alpha, partial [Candidatus Dormibacteria bacterium]